MENHKKLAHLLDVTQCVGCSACIVACAQTNYPDMLNAENTGWESLPANIRRVSAELARRPVELLVQCQQCENARCITVCPYDARWMHPKTGLPVKCMGKGCESLLKAGKDPACVAACPASARAFGDINDPSSAISQRLQHGRSERLMPQKGTRPNFFVVVNK